MFTKAALCTWAVDHSYYFNVLLSSMQSFINTICIVRGDDFNRYHSAEKGYHIEIITTEHPYL